jgi:AbrB family looped-hinge helix DNA binding protein
MAQRDRSGGFDDARSSVYTPRAGKPSRYENLKLGEGGRVVIPAAMRVEMGVKPGDTLIANVEDGALKLVSRRMALRQVQDKAAKYKKAGENVVDSFLSERRAAWGEE